MGLYSTELQTTCLWRRAACINSLAWDPTEHAPGTDFWPIHEACRSRKMLECARRVSDRSFMGWEEVEQGGGENQLTFHKLASSSVDRIQDFISSILVRILCGYGDFA